ncbi:hypothetical protein Hanom_Chr13g01208011 [Helianthus anomalus]
MQQKLTLPSTSRSAYIWMQQRRYTTFFREDFRIRSKLCVSVSSRQNCVWTKSDQRNH